MTVNAGPVGIVGVGNMGGRIARRMIGAGYEVRAADTDGARISACGATPAAGLAARGVRYLDAGISGGAAAADTGTLTPMVGGDAGALATVRPVLDTFSARVHHMGPSGAGHVTKVLNNFLNGVTLAATAEVMVAGKKAGLDLAQLLEVINSSSGVNFASLNRFPRIITGDYLEGGLTGRLMAKDLRLYLSLAGDLGVSTLVGPGTLTAFQVSNALGYGDAISNRIADAYGDLVGGIRLAGQEG
jgi:3-hydroxyisobutyrate dehydrogenase